ncbi:hypothetical protein Fcan01_14935 [Folsomia candida]|uniref:Methyltransferase domain-containing protein n=1 Tax=Folsomia candida TaxID=158441 RepID=A0A226E190_FOLCA|nr:hypothetical protein Fcan01_14935 [Folsomia candida]
MNPKLRVLVLVVILLWLIIYRYVQTNSSPKSQTLSEGQYDQFEEKSQLPIQRNPIEESYYRNFIRKQFANSEKSYQEYRRRRREFVGSDLTKVDPWSTENLMFFWDYFLPHFSCPYTVQRIGGLGDGGKWVCGMELFDNVKPIDGKSEELFSNRDRPCIIYSFGVGGDVGIGYPPPDDPTTRHTEATVAEFDCKKEEPLSSSDRPTRGFRV